MKQIAGVDNRVSELVEKAKAGDRTSLEELVDLFHKEIYRMVYCRTNSPMDAEDLTQDIFLQMMKSLSMLKETNRFRAWLFSIAVNCVKDFHRKKRWIFFRFITDERDSEEEDVSEQVIAHSQNNPERLMMRKEFWEHFHQFRASLPKSEGEVFMLRYVDHLGIREIAEILKRSESTVKTHLYRAIKKFKQNPQLHDFLKGEG